MVVSSVTVTRVSFLVHYQKYQQFNYQYQHSLTEERMHMFEDQYEFIHVFCHSQN